MNSSEKKFATFGFIDPEIKRVLIFLKTNAIVQNGFPRKKRTKFFP